MAEFSSYDPDHVEVSGEIIASFLAAFPDDLRHFGVEVLAKHNIQDPSPGTFYRAQPFLDSLKEVGTRLGRNVMNRIGERTALQVRLPPNVNSLKTALEGLDDAYHSKYRGGEIGHWTYQEEESKSGVTYGKMISTNHYCCAFDRGVLEGFAKRFRPEGISDVLVRHDDNEPCRKNGASSCTYIISWG